jgi:transposase-like protein
VAGKKPPGQANTLAKQAEREDRRREVARHLLAGRSVREIARIIGVSHQTVANDEKRVREEWRSQYALTVDEWAKQETARYDTALAAIWHGVEKGQFEAIDRFVKLSVARRELLGLDAPKRVEAKMEVTQGVSPEALDGKLDRIAAALAAAGPPGGPDAG